MREVEATIVIKLKTTFTDEESDAGTARYCFEEDLESAEIMSNGARSPLLSVWNFQSIELAEDHERKAILQAAIDTWGIDKQLDMMI